MRRVSGVYSIAPSDDLVPVDIFVTPADEDPDEGNSFQVDVVSEPIFKEFSARHQSAIYTDETSSVGRVKSLRPDSYGHRPSPKRWRSSP